ncbi:hypothetical protein [Dehalogenimonas etheniformans]|uniref:Uncharacterized protein n=1 Tax=Dehalogenimonas etheniformans TaxID=1536648 RepID=A0A2P5P5T6_9CHLR|nr:hypothetical protein [Dehalogenimonas etheniformans]PPD57650.1 hypothetical protein JP09_007875 [Dehalogenimonas etheniformans]QNT75992.1 hypothetical protein HX448_04460 [Dehalogenimonas etheniformans]
MEDDGDLNPKETAFLLHCVVKHDPELIDKIKPESLNGGDSALINRIRDDIGQEIMEEGLTIESELNEYGLELENLIDRLANLYLWPAD